MRPNIVVLLCDQMRRQAMSFAGEPNVRTPHLDHCAAHGVYFENACSTYPICVPFRFSLMTGEYAHTRMIPGIAWRMSPAERTIAHSMNDAGYETAYFGKWHLYGGGSRLIPGHELIHASRTPIPRSYQGGFQYWRGFELRNDPYDTCYFIDDDPTPRPLKRYQTDGLVDLFAQYVKHDRDPEKPFFCIVSVEPPHNPLIAPPENMERMSGREIVFRANVPLEKRNERLRQDTLTYHAMIENLDDNVGRMLRLLCEEGLWENTIFIFLSDHGDLMGSHGLRQKQHPYEESVGIPFIVCSGNPALAQPGVRISDPVSTEDFFPTFCGLASIEAGSSKPGLDLSSLIQGKKQHVPRAGVMLEFVAELRPTAVYHQETWRAFRTRTHKYTVRGGRPWQLFDLETDPFELHNLLEDEGCQDIACRLHGLLRERLQETGDDYSLMPAFGHESLNLYCG